MSSDSAIPLLKTLPWSPTAVTLSVASGQGPGGPASSGCTFSASPSALFGLGVLCSTHHCLELFIACCLISPPSPVPTNSPSYGENKRPGAETLPSHCHVPTQHLKRACRMGFCMREGISCSFIGNFNFLYEPSPQLRLLFFDCTACHVVS